MYTTVAEAEAPDAWPPRPPGAWTCADVQRSRDASASRARARCAGAGRSCSGADTCHALHVATSHPWNENCYTAL